MSQWPDQAFSPPVQPDFVATGLLKPGGMTTLDTGTKLAVERTRLAHERTRMAWVRTAASLISFGFTIYGVLFQV